MHVYAYIHMSTTTHMHTCVYVKVILNELISTKVYSYISLRERTRETMLLHELISMQIFIGLSRIKSIYFKSKTYRRDIEI